jgi:hypothetical protein
LSIVFGEVGSTVMIAILLFFMIRELIIIVPGNYDILFSFDFLNGYERMSTIILLVIYSMKQYLLINQNLEIIVMFYLLTYIVSIILVIIKVNKIYFNDSSVYICKDNRKIIYEEVIQIIIISDSQVKLITKDEDYILHANRTNISLVKNKISKKSIINSDTL